MCGLLDPLACVPQDVWTALDTWRIAISLWPWFVGVAIVSLVIGAWLGPAKTSVLVTAGIALIWLSKRGSEPAWETGEPDPKPRRKQSVPKRRTLKDLFKRR